MKRSEIYGVIDGERSYQGRSRGVHNDNTLVNCQPPVHTFRTEDGHLEYARTIGDFVSYIGEALKEANSAYYKGNTQDALTFIRKAAGLAVACFEQHGVPPR